MDWIEPIDQFIAILTVKSYSYFIIFHAILSKIVFFIPFWLFVSKVYKYNLFLCTYLVSCNMAELDYTR